MEGARSRTWVGAGPSPEEKEEKVDGDPEANKMSESLGASVALQVNGFNIHLLQIQSSTLLLERSSQQSDYEFK